MCNIRSSARFLCNNLTIYSKQVSHKGEAKNTKFISELQIDNAIAKKQLQKEIQQNTIYKGYKLKTDHNKLQQTQGMT